MSKAPTSLSRAAAPSAAVLAWVLCLGAVVVTTRSGTWDVPAMNDQVVDLALGLSLPVMGSFVLAGRRSSRRLGWLFVGAGLASSVTCLVAAIAASAVTAGPLARTAVFVNGFSWVPAFLPLVTLVPLLYPDGGLPGQRWRVVAWSSVIGIAALMLATGLHDETFHGRIDVSKPFSADSVATPLGVLAVVLLVPSVLASVASLVVRLVGSTGLARRQVAVLLSAAGLLVAEVAVHSALPSGVASVAQAVAVLLVPVAIGVAITRHRLFDLDLALCRALVAVSAAACLAGAFLTLLTIFEGLLGTDTAVATALAAGATGLLLQPLTLRLAKGADRLLYGDRADPFSVLTQLSSQLRDGLPLDEISTAVCERIVSILRLGSATIEVGERGGRVTAGRPAGTRYNVPLLHRGEVVGRLTVTPRPGEQDLDAQDRALVAAIGDQIAPVISSVSAFAAVRRSREALVAAREEERRRLRNDLHDGVGAALAGVRLQLESARALVADPVAGRLLDSAGAGVAEAVHDVRQVTEDLRPPALDELGLAGSLHALADRLDGPGREVVVEVAELPGLPAAVEVAAYRIAAEALNNAVRHSGGRCYSLTARHDGRWLAMAVEDDGGWLSGTRAAGLGLASMRQRAEEVGGRIEISTRAGTCVRVLLPLELA